MCACASVCLSAHLWHGCEHPGIYELIRVFVSRNLQETKWKFFSVMFLVIPEKNFKTEQERDRERETGEKRKRERGRKKGREREKEREREREREREQGKEGGRETEQRGRRKMVKKN